ncbi:hypothetical protein IAT38_005139 [Cryptococcus sp. DSM 104549]
MAVEPVSVQAEVPVVDKSAKANGTSVPNGAEQQEQQQQEQGQSVEGLQEGVQAISLTAEGGASNFHAACAEGKLEEVRAMLGGGFVALESLDANTGCTPVVLAVRGNHHEVVRELLTAGAMVPPPGLTNDPHMLSVLYPQPIYGMPPQFMGMPPQEYYPQPNYFQGQGGEAQQQQQQQRGPFPPRKESVSAPNGNGAAANSNLPPAEVSKTIPCRNFPNCKYGASCVFFHPRQMGFYSPGPQAGGFLPPQGYEGVYPPPYPPIPGPYVVPGANGFQSFAPADGQQPASEIPDQTTTQHDNTPHPNGSAPIPPHVPSAVAPVFVPGFQPGDMMHSPPPPSHFGLSPLSPSMLGTSLPSIPPAEVFFATSPTNGFAIPPPMNGAPHARRQSFGQGAQFGVGPQQGGKPYGAHGKKPSFSGGKPWVGGRQSMGGAAKLGAWKDGNPPPCAFFSQGNCRNGEYCKFPHLDAEGNDCRHPDVVRGVIAPLPSLSRQNRGMRMGGPGFNSFDPAFRQQQAHQQQMQFLQHQRMAAAQAQQGVPAPVAEGDAPATAAKADAPAAAEAPAAAKEDKEAAASTEATATPAQAAPAQQSTAAALPPKPAAAAMPSIIRSASQPGVQRVHANGLNSRSHSPAPSNVSFHGNGHPRRAGSRAPNGGANGAANGGAGANGGARSASSGAAEKKAQPAQRVPQAHEFPALGIATPTSEKKEPQWGAGGKTAAQVLQAPAPVKPVAVKVADEEGSVSGKSEGANSVTMESESDSDAVLVSCKPSTAATPVSAASPAPEAKKPISFASVAGSVPVPALESAPVALKA